MNNWKKNRWLKLGGISLGIIIITLLIELFYFNFQPLFNGYEELRYDFTKGQNYDNVIVEDIIYETDQVKDGKTVKVKGEETDYTFEFPENTYIKKLHIKYKGKVEFTVKMLITEDDGYGREIQEEFYDTANPSYQDFHLNIGQDAKECKIRVVGNTGGEIESIGFSNNLQLNPYRMFFVAVVLLIFTIFVFSKDLFGKKLEYYFAVFCFLSGTLMILNIGTLRAGWDEQVHFERIYTNANFSQVEWTDAANVMRDATQLRYNTIEERKIAEDYYESIDNIDNPDISSKQRFISYSQRSYITQSIMIAIGRFLNMPFAALYMFGKFGNLLLYTFVVSLAIRLAKTGKAIIATIGLLPTSIFLASCYAYDSVTISFSLLALVLWINELIKKDEKLKWTSALAIIGCFLIASLSKGVYIPLILLLCFLPATKFDSKRQKAFFCIGVIAVMFIMMYTYLEPVTTNTFRGNMDWGGDNRNIEGETGDVKQLSYMLQYPVTYLKLLLGSIFKSFCDYMFGIGAALNFAFLNAYSGQFTYLLTPFFLGLGFIQCEEEVPYTLNKKYKMLITTLVFGIICMIWTALYMNFTVVGSLKIDGVQPRYYIPIMAFLLYACRNRVFVCKWKQQTYNKVVMGIISFIVLYGVYTLLLKPYNF